MYLVQSNVLRCVLALQEVELVCGCAGGLVVVLAHVGDGVAGVVPVGVGLDGVLGRVGVAGVGGVEEH